MYFCRVGKPSLSSRLYVLYLSSVLLFVFFFIKPTESMRLVLQRVKSASVSVDGSKVSQIGSGVVALVGLHEHDTHKNLVECCKKLLTAKLWPNDNGGQWR